MNSNVIINSHNPVTNDGINIENANWIIIDGFNVINQPRAGIRIAVSDFVTIKNNTCTNNAKWGIFTGFTDDITIENNSCSYSQQEHGIYVSNSSDRPVIINNHSFNNNSCGIHMNGDISQGGDGIISNAIVAGNIIHDNGNAGGSAINMDGVQDSKIFNNLIYNNHSTGIAMYMIDAAEGSKNNKVYNNTIINPPIPDGILLLLNGSTGNTFYNNILINHHSFRGSIAVDPASTQNFVSDYNILVNRLSDDDGDSNMGLSQWQSLGYDLHSIIAEPEENIFADPNSGNFHLISGSQPVDMGTSLVSSIVSEDLDKVLRPQGNGFDIGAYEFTSASLVGNVDNQVSGFELYQNYPNPFNPATKITYIIASEAKQSQFVSLKVYDVLGNEVAILVNEEKPAGEYKVEFSPNNLSSGIYFYKLQAGSFTVTRKMVYLK